MKEKVRIPFYYSPYHIMYEFYKSVGTKKERSKNINGTLSRIPANGQDIFNYVARYRLANFQIQAVMKLDGRLDFDKLSEAVRLSFDAEPVFGCRFVEGIRPYWKRIGNIDSVKYCTFEETDDPETAVEDFLNVPLNLDTGPMAKVKLIRSGQGDTLCIKVSHVCCDGTGAKEYFMLLADIYSKLDRDGTYTPTPRIPGNNDRIRLYRALNIDVPKAIMNPKPIPIHQLWKFPWKNNRIGATRFVVCKLPRNQLEKMKKYAKARGATINDLLLTATYRAMFEISDPPYDVPLDIPITLDLRRYLPDQKTEAIRNFAAGIVTTLTRKRNESFSDTLSRVMAETRILKGGHLDPGDIVWGERIEKMNFYQYIGYFMGIGLFAEMASHYPFFDFTDKCSVTLANLGFVSRSPIKFGEHTVTDAYVLPPVLRAPGILLVATTYNNIITLGVGYYEPTVRRSDMENILNKIRDELIEGCN